MTGRVEGKVALITGAARGQGRSHAVRLASEGANIVAIDICENMANNPYPLGSEADLAETVRLVEKEGRSCVPIKADVRDLHQMNDAVKQGLERLGKIDIVCANAGVLTMGAGKGAQAYMDAFAVDFVGVFNTVQATMNIVPDGASIIITGSTAALLPQTLDNPAMGGGGAGYGDAKKALLPFTEAIARQLAPRFVRVNCIHPTNCNTHLLHHEDLYKIFRPDLEHPTLDDAMPAFMTFQAMPIPYIEPIDMSNLVLFLASEESRYITGHHIRVDAGSLLQVPGSARA